MFILESYETILIERDRYKKELEELRKAVYIMIHEYDHVDHDNLYPEDYYYLEADWKNTLKLMGDWYPGKEQI